MPISQGSNWMYDAGEVAAYTIGNSLKLEADNSEFLRSDNISTTPTNTKIGTFSFWVKRTELGENYLFVAGNSARYSRMFFNSDNKIQLFAGDSSWNSVQPITNGSFTDCHAWYHLVLRIDTTQADVANRLRLYVNGVEQTWATAPNIDEDATPTLLEAFGSPGYHSWSANLAYYSASAFFSGYLAEVFYIDGQTLAPTSFGETNNDGVWDPIEYDGTVGNCGYYMDFADSGNLGDNEASTGSTFDFNENAIAAADQSTDTPTNNFCTWSPLWDFTVNGTISEGGTKLTHVSGTNWGAKSSIGVQNGKWYWEAKPVGIIGGQYIGIQTDGDADINSGTPISNAENFVVTPEGYHYKNGGSETNFSVTFDADDIMGIALDLDSATNTFKLYKNNSLELTYNLWADITDVVVIPFCQLFEDRKFTINFGGYTLSSISSAANDANGYGNFEYAPPSGYYALCTKNIAEYG